MKRIALILMEFMIKKVFITIDFRFVPILLCPIIGFSLFFSQDSAYFYRANSFLIIYEKQLRILCIGC